MGDSITFSHATPILVEKMNFTAITANWIFLSKALWITFSISALSMVLGFLIGVFVGGFRTYGGRFLDIILGFYVDTIRSVPLLVVLLWVYFAFPLIIGRSIDVYVAAVVGLGVQLGAYGGNDPSGSNIGTTRSNVSGVSTGYEPRRCSENHHSSAGIDPNVTFVRVPIRFYHKGQRYCIRHCCSRTVASNANYCW